MTTAAADPVYDADPQMMLFLSTTVAWSEVHCYYWVQSCLLVVWGKICYTTLHMRGRLYNAGACAAMHSMRSSAQHSAASAVLTARQTTNNNKPKEKQ